MSNWQPWEEINRTHKTPADLAREAEQELQRADQAIVHLVQQLYGAGSPGVERLSRGFGLPASACYGWAHTIQTPEWPQALVVQRRGYFWALGWYSSGMPLEGIEGGWSYPLVRIWQNGSYKSPGDRSITGYPRLGDVTVFQCLYIEMVRKYGLSLPPTHQATPLEPPLVYDPEADETAADTATKEHWLRRGLRKLMED